MTNQRLSYPTRSRADKQSSLTACPAGRAGEDIPIVNACHAEARIDATIRWPTTKSTVTSTGPANPRNQAARQVQSRSRTVQACALVHSPKDLDIGSLAQTSDQSVA